MTFVSFLSRSAAAAAMLACIQCVAAESDPQLLGCWRLQEQRYVFADGHSGRGNADCVVEYGAAQVAGRCRSGAGPDTTTEHSWTLAEPGVTHLTDVAAPDTRYRIEGDWLMTSQDIPAAPASGPPRPVRIERIAVREASGCMTRGDQHLRTGKGPTSSLALHAPPGWTVRLDAPQPAIPAMVVGVFSNGGSPQVAVTVLDLFGPESGPMQPADFAAMRTAAKSDRDLTIRCDEPQRLCAIRQLRDGVKAYQEMFVLRGRAVAVVSTGKDSNENQWREAASLFAQALRADNAAPKR